MALTGEDGGPHIRSPISPIDQTTGMHALTGILAALYARQADGMGRRIDVGQLDAQVALMDQAIAQAEQAELGWRSSVLGAVEEVQASLDCTPDAPMRCPPPHTIAHQLFRWWIAQ